MVYTGRLCSSSPSRLTPPPSVEFYFDMNEKPPFIVEEEKKAPFMLNLAKDSISLHANDTTRNKLFRSNGNENFTT